jgi:hypothetical protein
MQYIDALDRVIEQTISITLFDTTSEQVQISTQIKYAINIGANNDVVVFFTFTLVHFFLDSTDIAMKLG